MTNFTVETVGCDLGDKTSELVRAEHQRNQGTGIGTDDTRGDESVLHPISGARRNRGGRALAADERSTRRTGALGAGGQPPGGDVAPRLGRIEKKAPDDDQ